MSANEASGDSTTDVVVQNMIQNPASVDSYRKGGFIAGHDSRRGRTGGRPRVLKEIQDMLNTEHRNPEKMREVFTRLRALALGTPILLTHVTPTGEMQFEVKLQADARFMQLYLDRLMGPASKPIEDDDAEEILQLFADAPVEVIEYLKVKLIKRR